MYNLLTKLSAMTGRRRVAAILSIAALAATTLFLYRAATAPSFALLYASLDAAAASEIAARLEQEGEPYEIRGNAIFVDSSARDTLRLRFAGEGLPAGGVQGYELLDGMGAFGTTSQMFDAAYWRAREGELARTILATPRVRTARVHISEAGARAFDRPAPRSASVSVTLSGGELSLEHARAIRYLVASAVQGLAPENVAIIDAAGGLILAEAEEKPESAITAAASEMSARLAAGVERLLEARVGRGNAVVEISVELDPNTESIVERTFDPEQRVAISTDTEEETESSSNGGPAAVTVASNLPDGDTAGGGNSGSNASVTREKVNYEVSESTRQSSRAAGGLRKITAAILLNGIAGTDANGAPVISPRTPEEIEALTELVKAAVGFDEARGDLVTVNSMEFPVSEDVGTLAEAGLFDQFGVNLVRLLQLGVLSLVAMVLGLFVVRPVLAVPVAPLIGALPPPADVSSLPPAADPGAAKSSDAAGPPDPAQDLRALIAGKSLDSTDVLKGWIGASAAIEGGRS
jgi:flagellar M-ring protein FliF